MLNNHENLEFYMNRLDQIINNINNIAKKNLLSNELKNRNEKRPVDNLDDTVVMKKFIELIAFSNNANSSLVSNIIRKGIFDDIFENYDIDKISQLNAEDIIQQHWNKIKCIRFKYKISAMISCSQYLIHIKEKYGSFMKLLINQEMPKKINEVEDVEKFWRAFKNIQKTLINMNIPYFKNTTSLCHLLMDLGYDCVKPDKVVMDVCSKIGIVSNSKRDKDLKNAVKFIQLYSIDRKIRPSSVDVYLLIYGGQEWAKQFL